MYFFEDLKNVKEIEIVEIFEILKTPNILFYNLLL